MNRILHMIPTFEGGGAERQLSMLAIEQVKRGMDVHIGVRRSSGIYWGLLQQRGVIIHVMGDYRGIDPRLILRTIVLICRLKPGIVQTWLPQMDLVGGVAALLMSVPWVISERTSGMAFQTASIRTWVRSRLARFAKAIVANSVSGANYWKERLPGNRVATIANAVDVDAIQNSEKVECEAICKGKQCLLVVGRLAPEKALDIVIKAIAALEKPHSFHVLVVGDGPLRKVILEQISNAGLDESVTMLPFQPAWWGMLKCATALISMSRFEGHPNVVLEAIAAGCPLIVSDIPAHREFLNEDAALLVQSDNSAELASAIASLLANPAEARRRADRAAHCVEDLTIHTAANAYETVYRNLLKRSMG